MSTVSFIGKFNNLQITTIVLFFIIIASASTNLVVNLIPAQYSLINFKPSKLNLQTTSYFIGFLGLLISLFCLYISDRKFYKDLHKILLGIFIIIAAEMYFVFSVSFNLENNNIKGLRQKLLDSLINS